MKPSHERQFFGESGTVCVGSTSGTITGDFSEILCVGSTTFTTLTDTYTKTTAEYGNKATGTLAFSTGALTAGDTVTVAGQEFTAVAENATPTAIQFKIGTSYATAAANAMAAINAHAATAAQVVVTSAVVASTVVLTVTAVARGTAGNDLTIAKSAANVAVLPVDGSLDGGTALAAMTGAALATGTILRGKFTAVAVSGGVARCTVSSPLP